MALDYHTPNGDGAEIARGEKRNNAAMFKFRSNTSA